MGIVEFDNHHNKQHTFTAFVPLNVHCTVSTVSSDIFLFGEDNWFCVYGADKIVPMLKYAQIYEQSKNKNKGFQYLIQ